MLQRNREPVRTCLTCYAGQHALMVDTAKEMAHQSAFFSIPFPFLKGRAGARLDQTAIFASMKREQGLHWA
eukprot:scaffold50313_cov20-Tisochrysis_lutea.AAC.1